MHIDVTVWVLASISLVMEAPKKLATMPTPGETMVRVNLKVMRDTCSKMEAVLLFHCPILSILRQYAFWAVVDDLVVTPLVDCHLTPFARKSLLPKAPNEFLAHGTKYRLPECRWYEFVPLDRKNFLHISPPLDDLLLISIHPLGNLKDEASTWVHRLCELTRLASCLQISGINLTSWSWHLSSKILVNLEELKVHLLIFKDFQRELFIPRHCCAVLGLSLEFLIYLDLDKGDHSGA